MMPDPLHPAVVHLPIALAVLVPGFALAGIFLIFKGLLHARTWVGVVLLQLLLLGSGWLALETGEREEERVERVVAERYIETHEEAADRFLVVAGIGLLLTAGGLLPGRAGAAGRVAGALASLAVLGDASRQLDDPIAEGPLGAAAPRLQPLQPTREFDLDPQHQSLTTSS